MAEQSGNQSLKEHKKESVDGGGLTDVLKAKIKAILLTKIRKILNQNPNFKDEIMLLSGIPDNKGTSDTPCPKLNKGKRDLEYA